MYCQQLEQKIQTFKNDNVNKWNQTLQSMYFNKVFIYQWQEMHFRIFYFRILINRVPRSHFRYFLIFFHFRHYPGRLKCCFLPTSGSKRHFLVCYEFNHSLVTPAPRHCPHCCYTDYNESALLYL